MFTKKVTDDDKFMALSASAQALYFHLSMAADDDGFCNQISVCMFKAHASVQDLKSLLEARYVYQFDNGVIVIKHWRMANALRKDRYSPTIFQEELAKLKIKNDGSYLTAEEQEEVFESGAGFGTESLVAGWLPDGCQMVATWLPQDRIGKDSIDKNNINISLSKDNDRQTEVRQNIQTAVNAWNSLECLGYSKISKMSSSSNRYKMLKARIMEYGIDDVLKAIENVKNSSYLKEQTWFAFDWFVRPNNFPKVLEGKYNKGSDNAKTFSQTQNDYYDYERKRES